MGDPRQHLDLRRVVRITRGDLDLQVKHPSLVVRFGRALEVGMPQVHVVVQGPSCDADSGQCVLLDLLVVSH